MAGSRNSAGLRVLIVGGGIGGLAAAIALHDKGIAVEVVERSPEWPTTGAVGVLHANGVRALDRLGVAAVIADGARALEYQEMCDEHGQALSRTDLRELWGDVGPTYGVDRPTLMRALRSRAEQLPHRLGVGVVSVEQGSSQIAARLSDGKSASYDLIVGANGVHSNLRPEVDPTAAARYAGQVYWRTIGRSPVPEAPGVTVLFGDGRFFGLVPLIGGRAFAFAATFAAEAPREPVGGRLARLRETFARFGEPVVSYLAGLETDEQIHWGPTETVTMATWHRGRVVLVGDAAHAIQPMMAQGCSMALEDAVVLADCLSSATDLEAALAGYETRRMSRVAWVQEQTAVLAKGFAMAPEIRNGLLSARGDAMTKARFRPLAEVA